MNTKKYDLPMRNFKNRYSETDLPSLVPSKPTIVRWLRINMHLPPKLVNDGLYGASVDQLFIMLQDAIMGKDMYQEIV